MEHPNDGMIRALLDGEALKDQERLEAHLVECPRCAEVASAQSSRLQAVTEALAVFDKDPPLEMARARLLRREREILRGWSRVRRNLPRAASFAVLITAGAAAALPGSPVRDWLVGGWESLTSGGDPSPASLPGEEEAPGGGEISGGAETVGATLRAVEGRIELHVRDLPSEASVTILLVPGDQAGIFAEEGTRFRSERGRLEAVAPPGDVTVEVPSGASQVLVIVNGDIFLRKTDQGMELFGPVRTRTPTEIRFGPSSAPSNGPPSTG